ncbi:hypothetical protein F2P81_019965 [Scophthalmus maximus]|uniref:Sideroflexin-4 n=1 Tax=Scophthalmus maximus TaxID=52904 RepID=A0A6A4S982_SCOMX|nr:hypothetical protein F2P81_019965 [Scophthalmus maximus]
MRIWLDLLDPTLLFASDAEIQKARTLLTSAEKSEKDASVPSLSLSSVHADSGAVLPLVFRPPALLTISAPLAVASFLPYNTIKPALFWQLLLQSYNAGFNYANRNSSSEQGKQQSLNRLLLIGGTISYATCAGVLPQISINFLHLKSAPVLTFFRSIVPIPLSAALAYFSVLTVRSEEWEAGIQVFDSNGNPVGISKAAGEKDETFPEELSAGRSPPSHKHRISSGPDDPSVVQSLSTTGDDKEGKVGGGATGCGGQRTLVLSQRTLRSTYTH